MAIVPYQLGQLQAGYVQCCYIICCLQAHEPEASDTQGVLLSQCLYVGPFGVLFIFWFKAGRGGCTSHQVQFLHCASGCKASGQLHFLESVFRRQQGSRFSLQESLMHPRICLGIHRYAARNCLLSMSYRGAATGMTKLVKTYALAITCLALGTCCSSNAQALI